MTYFKPWRRRIGVVLLLCAANVAVICIRSLVTRDTVNFLVGSNPVWIVSELGTIRWARVLETDLKATGLFYTWDVEDFPVPRSFSDSTLPEQQRLCWRWLGFASFPDQNNCQVWIISYLSVIYSLVLVSGCLFLIKSRASHDPNQAVASDFGH